MRRLVPGATVGRTRSCDLVLEATMPIALGHKRVGRCLLATHVSRSKTYKPNGARERARRARLGLSTP
jgi:hypothetical protein